MGSQVSRPVQIALIAVVLLAAVWFVALRPKSTSGGSGTPAPVTHPATPSSSGSSGGPNAPGVAGLGRAIDKAHGAVRQSQDNANQLQQHSDAVSGQGGSAPASGASTTPAPTTTGTPPATAKAPSTSAKPPAPKTPPTPTGHGAPAIAARALAQHKVLAILFYNPGGADDEALRGAFRHLDTRNGKVVVLSAPVTQVASFTAVTAKVSITGSPEVVIFDHTGDAHTYLGYMDPDEVDNHIADALAD